jgi:uncharacterized protein (DUF697 family)
MNLNSEFEKTKALPEGLERDREAEKLCRWAAARAGVIVVAPLVGTMSLMANEFYMVLRLSELYGEELDEGAIWSLLAALGGTFVGQTLVTLIPFAPVQVPVGISVTYGVGKVVNTWFKAGRPEDLAQFKSIYEEARAEGIKNFNEFVRMSEKDKPLGDESKRFNFRGQVGPLYKKLKDNADKMADKIEKNVFPPFQ